MAIRVNYSTDPYIARLQRKRDQQHELMCLALIDGDKEAAKRHEQEAEQLKQAIRDAR